MTASTSFWNVGKGDGEYRIRLTNIQAGGGLYAQRIVTRRHYDLDRAKNMALAVAGLADGGH